MWSYECFRRLLQDNNGNLMVVVLGKERNDDVGEGGYLCHSWRYLQVVLRRERGTLASRKAVYEQIIGQYVLVRHNQAIRHLQAQPPTPLLSCTFSTPWPWRLSPPSSPSPSPQPPRPSRSTAVSPVLPPDQARSYTKTLDSTLPRIRQRTHPRLFWEKPTIRNGSTLLILIICWIGRWVDQLWCYFFGCCRFRELQDDLVEWVPRNSRFPGRDQSYDNSWRNVQSYPSLRLKQVQVHKTWLHYICLWNIDPFVN